MPQPRKHEHGAARVAAHRSRQALEGRQRLDVTVTAATAAKLKAEATARGCTIGEALEALLASTSATIGTGTRTTTAKAATVPDTTAPVPTGAAETAAPDQAGPEAPNGMAKATSATTTATSTGPEKATSTSQRSTRRTRRRCPRSGDPGVETRHRDGWDRFTVLVDGVAVGTVSKARSGWRGETTAGHTVEGRVATAAVNRVLKAAHQAGLLEANTAGPEQAGAA